MKEKLLKIAKYLLFLGIGVGIVMFMSRKVDWAEQYEAAKNMKWIYFLYSTIFGLAAHWSRAYRWRLLIQPLGYNPRMSNMFCSVMFMYLSNILVPRSGEVARCGTLYKYEKVPVPKLLGTVIIERLADILGLLILSAFLFFWQFDLIKGVYTYKDPDEINSVSIQDKMQGLFDNKLMLLAIAICGILFFFLVFKLRKKIFSFGPLKKIPSLLKDIKEGLIEISTLKKKWEFIFHSILIWILYVCMFYVCFFAYEPTEDLGFKIGFTCFILGSFGMVAPTNGGMGTWQLMVILGLQFSLGLTAKETGPYVPFANTAFFAMTMISIIFGAICTFALPYINKKPKEELV